jgi:phage major head subunit gpT-like protein
MANPIGSAQFIRLLEKRFDKVFDNEIKEIPPMIDQLYTRTSSTTAMNEYFEIGAIGDIPEFNGALTYLSMNPGYATKIEPKEYAAGLQFERKFLKDKQYPVMENKIAALTKSANRTMDKIAVRPFAYAFSNAFDFMTSEEGVSLCSDSHTTKSGVSTTYGFDNAGTSALNKTSLAATRLLMRKFKDDIGNRIEINPDTLIVPDYLYDTAMEIIGSEKDPENANNTKNMMNGRFKVLPYLRLDDFDTNNWFMVDGSLMKQFLLWIDREKPFSTNTIDFETYIWKFAIYFRIACGHLNWRFCFGHNVT